MICSPNNLVCLLKSWISPNHNSLKFSNTNDSLIFWICYFTLDIIFMFIAELAVIIKFQTSHQLNQSKHNNMDSRRPTQWLPFQCPSTHCQKGFENLGDVCKHIAMSTQCGLYLQKLLHTQSIYLTNKSALATNNATTPTLPSFQPGTTWFNTTIC